jgi:8-oxo-dGTP pyrophosphatase MutT (NUDIX family)
MSTRNALIAQLGLYRPADPHEERMRARILNFVQQYPDCFRRTLRVGHVTGSAWVINRERTHTLLVHHRRLGKWLQPGGHAEDESDALAVAVREAEEETGLRVRPVSAAIFDVDAHAIPERKKEPAHVHYDIRYMVEADMTARVVVSPESRAVEWVRLSQVAAMNTDESVLRLVRKTRA